MDLKKEVLRELKRFPKLYATQNMKPEDVEIIMKFFDPCGSWTWYATECNLEENGDYIFFGLVRGFENELGYFSLNELSGVKGRMGLGIERDKHFGKHYLKEAMEKQI